MIAIMRVWSVFLIWISITGCHTKNETTMEVAVVEDSLAASEEESPSMPSKLNMTISLFQNTTDVVDLKLDMNKAMNEQRSVYIIRTNKDGKSVLKKQQIPIEGNIALYQDKDTGASVLVTCDGFTTGHCDPSLEGSFYVNNVEYGLEPLAFDSPERRKRSLPGFGRRGKLYSVFKRKQDKPVKDDFQQETSKGQSMQIVDRIVDIGDILAPPDISPVMAMWKKVSNVNIGPQMPDIQPHNHHIPYEMGLVVIVDFSVYQSWYRKSNKVDPVDRDIDAKSKIRQYIAHVINGVDLRFQNLRNNKIKVVVSRYIIADSPAASPWTTDRYRQHPRDLVHADDALTELVKWRYRMGAELPVHDHIILFTGHDLYRQSLANNGVAGFARVKSMCTHSSASIVEEHGGFTSVLTATHEIGHSLGAYHDGYKNLCTGKTNHIMTPIGGSASPANALNPFKFSTCSEEAFQEYLDSLPRNNCLTDETYIWDDEEFRHHLKQKAGQLYGPNEQCQQIMGDASYYAWGGILGDSSDICTHMSCKNTLSNTSFNVYYAARGTSCGDKKWCMNGLCTYSSDAPARKETCVHGDAWRLFANQTCTQYVNEDPSRCYLSYYRRFCCDSCDRVRRDEPRCEFGNRKKICDIVDKDVAFCYHGDNAKMCCESCNRHNTGVEGCEFGDRIVNCNASQCGYEEHAKECCRTCSRVGRNHPSTYSTRPLPPRVQPFPSRILQDTKTSSTLISRHVPSPVLPEQSFHRKKQDSSLTPQHELSVTPSHQQGYVFIPPANPTIESSKHNISGPSPVMLFNSPMDSPVPGQTSSRSPNSWSPNQFESKSSNTLENVALVSPLSPMSARDQRSGRQLWQQQDQVQAGEIIPHNHNVMMEPLQLQYQSQRQQLGRRHDQNQGRSQQYPDQIIQLQQQSGHNIPGADHGQNINQHQQERYPNQVKQLQQQPDHVEMRQLGTKQERNQNLDKQIRQGHIQERQLQQQSKHIQETNLGQERDQNVGKQLRRDHIKGTPLKQQQEHFHGRQLGGDRYKHLGKPILQDHIQGSQLGQLHDQIPGSTLDRYTNKIQGNEIAQNQIQGIPVGQQDGQIKWEQFGRDRYQNVGKQITQDQFQGQQLGQKQGQIHGEQHGRDRDQHVGNQQITKDQIQGKQLGRDRNQNLGQQIIQDHIQGRPLSQNHGKIQGKQLERNGNHNQTAQDQIHGRQLDQQDGRNQEKELRRDPGQHLGMQIVQDQIQGRQHEQIQDKRLGRDRDQNIGQQITHGIQLSQQHRQIQENQQGRHRNQNPSKQIVQDQIQRQQFDQQNDMILVKQLGRDRNLRRDRDQHLGRQIEDKTQGRQLDQDQSPIQEKQIGRDRDQNSGKQIIENQIQGRHVSQQGEIQGKQLVGDRDTNMGEQIMHDQKQGRYLNQKHGLIQGKQLGRDHRHHYIDNRIVQGQIQGEQLGQQHDQMPGTQLGQTRNQNKIGHDKIQGRQLGQNNDQNEMEKQTSRKPNSYQWRWNRNQRQLVRQQDQKQERRRQHQQREGRQLGQQYDHTQGSLLGQQHAPIQGRQLGQHDHTQLTKLGQRYDQPGILLVQRHDQTQGRQQQHKYNTIAETNPGPHNDQIQTIHPGQKHNQSQRGTAGYRHIQGNEKQPDRKQIPQQPPKRSHKGIAQNQIKLNMFQKKMPSIHVSGNLISNTKHFQRRTPVFRLMPTTIRQIRNKVSPHRLKKCVKTNTAFMTLKCTWLSRLMDNLCSGALGHFCCEPCESSQNHEPVCVDQKDCTIQSAGQCYDDMIRLRCCSTCRSHETESPDCRYGDRKMHCNLFLRYMPMYTCTKYENNCCRSCKRWKSQMTTEAPSALRMKLTSDLKDKQSWNRTPQMI